MEKRDVVAAQDDLRRPFAETQFHKHGAGAARDGLRRAHQFADTITLHAAREQELFGLLAPRLLAVELSLLEQHCRRTSVPLEAQQTCRHVVGTRGGLLAHTLQQSRRRGMRPKLGQRAGEPLGAVQLRADPGLGETVRVHADL